MTADISESEAIRRVLAAGGFADYVDVAQAVEKQFGLRVGSAKVEAVVLALRKEQQSAAADGNQQEQSAGTGGSSSAAEAAAPATDAATDRTTAALRFVEEMGGFAAAREALDELEASLKRIMK
jgi:hypothetical protein